MEFRIDTSFDKWGIFTLDAANGPWIHGRITYVPGTSPNLELVASPFPLQNLFGHDAPPMVNMFGQLADGPFVTLTRCIVTGASLGLAAPTICPITLHVGRVIFGYHIIDSPQATIARFSMGLSSLSQWATDCVFATTENLEQDQRLGLTVTCRIPATVCIQLPNQQFNIELHHHITSNHGIHRLSLAHHTLIDIVPHDAMTLADAEQAAWQCKHLFSLLIGHALSIRVARARLPGVTDTDPPASIVYQQVGRHDAPDAHPAEMLIPFDSIADELPVIFQRWFERSEQSILATNIFLSSRGSDGATLDSRFLVMLQAAESYHRSLDTGFYMDQDAYKTIIASFAEQIPAAIRGDHRQSLKNRLKYGNEFSLRKRLTELLSRIPTDVRNTLTPDPASFVSTLVDTRNYFTHYDHSARENALQGRAAHVAAEKVRILVVANLLVDLGIPPEQILPALQRHPESRHWISRPVDFDSR